MRCEPVPNPTRPCRKPLPRVSSPLTLTRPRDHKPHLVWGVHSGWGLRLHPLHWQAKEARLGPECWVPSRVSPSAPSLAGSSPGQGPPGWGGLVPNPPHPSVSAEVQPPPLVPQGTLVSTLWPVSREVRGRQTRRQRRSNPTPATISPGGFSLCF